jgi:osmotically-inducible protein OsmY
MKLTMNRTACTLLAAAALAAGLSACAPLFVGGAVMGGMMATDRRTTGIQVEDEGIELRAANRIREVLGDRAHVNVTSFNRQALLTGEVPTAQDRATVEKIVTEVNNVRAVVNDLGVMPNSSLGQRSNDTLITGKVRASFVDAKDVFTSAYKVVTERNVIYLMGLVTQREATRATEIARGVGGASKVVRVFELITEDDLRRASTQPPAIVTTDKPSSQGN